MGVSHRPQPADRFGAPAGYGLWFLYGVQILLQGAHHVASWVATDRGDPALATIVVIYVVTSVVLLASAGLVFGAVRKLGPAALPLVEQAGIDCLALGTDFDGTRVPLEIGDVTGLPKLIEALRERGYDDEALRKLASENWMRVLRKTWKM